MSYAEQWLPAGVPVRKKIFAARPLPEPPEEWRTVDVSQLVAFWTHPVRYFARHRLDMLLPEDMDVLADSEPFQPDSLEQYILAGRMVDSLLRGEDTEKIKGVFLAEGNLPHGSFGNNLFEELQEDAVRFVSEVQLYAQSRLEPVEVDLAFGSFYLKGWMNNLFREGCLRYRHTKLKARDLVQLWVEHLVFNALHCPEMDQKSRFVACDGTVAFSPVAEPHSFLTTLLDLYWQGLSDPLHFYPETSRAWAEGSEDRKTARARAAWTGDMFRRGEGDDIEYRVILQGRDPLDRTFEQLAETVYGPLLAHLGKEDAAV